MLFLATCLHILNCFEKVSKHRRHILVKNPSCCIFWIIVSLAFATASVPRILCFLIPPSSFLKSMRQTSRLQSRKLSKFSIRNVFWQWGQHIRISSFLFWRLLAWTGSRPGLIRLLAGYMAKESLVSKH